MRKKRCSLGETQVSTPSLITTSGVAVGVARVVPVLVG